jgi:hypothetical protein
MSRIQCALPSRTSLLATLDDFGETETEVISLILILRIELRSKLSKRLSPPVPMMGRLDRRPFSWRKGRFVCPADIARCL